MTHVDPDSPDVSQIYALDLLSGGETERMTRSMRVDLAPWAHHSHVVAEQVHRVGLLGSLPERMTAGQS